MIGPGNRIRATYGHDQAGRLFSMSYPMATSFSQTGTAMGTANFWSSYDSMGRPASLNGSQSDGSYVNWV